MIPKSTIQHHIYILLTLIYVCLIGRNWKFQNSPFKYTYIYLTLIYVPLIGENWKMKSKNPKVLSVLAHENYICNTLN